MPTRFRRSSGRQRVKLPLLGPAREAGARTDNALLHRRAHRHLRLRYARARRRSPMSGASLRAPEATECGGPLSGSSSSPPPSAVMRQRVGARSSMSGASLPATRERWCGRRPRIAARSPISGASWQAMQTDECGRSSSPHGCRSSTSVRAPGRRGRSGLERWRGVQRLPSSHRPAHRHLPLRCTRALRRVRRCAARRGRRRRREKRNPPRCRHPAADRRSGRHVQISLSIRNGAIPAAVPA